MEKEEKEKKNKKQVIIGISILLLVTLLLLGLTYAYYRTRIIGNTNSESISVTSKNLEVTYSEESSDVIDNGGEKIAPGFKGTKKFSVRNTGNGETSYSIKLDNIENSFQRLSDWTYKLYKGTDTTGELIAEGIIGHEKEQTIKSSATIANSATNNYVLEIEYANLKDEDQSIDMNASLSLRVNIGNADNTELLNAPEGTLLHAIGEANPNIINPLITPGKAPSGTYYVSTTNNETKTISLDPDYDMYTEYRDLDITYSDDYNFNSENGIYELKTIQQNKYRDIYSSLKGKYLISNDISYITNNNYNFANVNNKIYLITDATIDEISYQTIESKEKKFTETATALSTIEDDYGTSYYYRGNVTNNYLDFGGMCWRIVRIQGDGSIKIVLADKNGSCRNLSDTSRGGIIDEKTGSEDNGLLYTDHDDSFDSRGSLTDVTYKDSLVEKALNSWLNGGEYTYFVYSSGGMGYDMKTGNFSPSQLDKNKLETTSWCNDTSIYANGYLYYIEIGDTYGSVSNAVNRLKLSKTGASLKCNFEGIQNSKSTTVQSEIGLLTADEVVLAGAYLQNIKPDSFTMTPFSWSGTTPAGAFTYSLSGSYSHSGMSGAENLVPVVALKSTTKVTGSGTQTDPYIVI